MPLSKQGTDYVRNTISSHDPSLIDGSGMRVALRHRDNGGLKSYVEMMGKDFGEALQYSGTEETTASSGVAALF